MTEAAGLPPLAQDARRLARIAIDEDGAEDVTTLVTVAHAAQAVGVIEFRSGGVLAGTAYADAVADVAGCTRPVWNARDGQVLPPGAPAGLVRADLAALLRAERPLLNLLQRASGIATMTRSYVEAVAGTGCRVLHTRKTAPGLRAFDIRAVLAGGGAMHRADLAHAVMVKDNHWQALQQRDATLDAALASARARGVVACYVEVETMAQLEAACRAGATRLLIDNQAPGTLADWTAAARRLSPGIEIEATGGITLENVRAYAETGVDFVSIGALTHSVRAADIALEILPG